MLSGLVSKAGDAGAFGAIFNQLSDSRNAGFLDNLGGLIGGGNLAHGDPKDIAGRLMGSLFGDKTGGLLSLLSNFSGVKSSQDYPTTLRRIVYYDTENKRRLVFLTNNFTLPALTIARLYKSRWQVELFFKWIKQHLRIKAFYGTSDNAVKVQVWVAISVYVLVAIVKKELKLERSLYEILQILSLTLFEKSPIFQALNAEKQEIPPPTSPNQLTLFDL